MRHVWQEEEEGEGKQGAAEASESPGRHFAHPFSRAGSRGLTGSLPTVIKLG